MSGAQSAQRGVQALALLGRALQRALRFGQRGGAHVFSRTTKLRWPSFVVLDRTTRRTRRFRSAMLTLPGRASNPGWRRLPKKRRAAGKMQLETYSGKYEER